MKSSLLPKLIAEAKAELPELEVSAEEFQRYLQAHASQIEEPEKLPMRDLLLACACARGENKALQRFEAECMAKIGAHLGSIRLTAEQLQDMKQNLRQKLFVSVGDAPPRITQYAGMSKLFTWVRVAAVREALNMLRSAKPESLDEDAVIERVMAGPDPELEHLKTYYREQFNTAFKEALASLTPRERNLLRYSILDRLTCEQIGALHGVHTATASRWLTKLKQVLLVRTRKYLGRDLGLSRDDLDSVLRLIESRLDMSFSGLKDTQQRGAQDDQ